MVRTTEAMELPCRLKGKFRIKGSKATNPVVVGDKVEIIIQDEEQTGIIETIKPRSNYIVRRATRLSKQSHVIAANLDQACLIVTLAFPRTSTGFIDRFLITSEAYHIPAAIIFNKLDLYDEETLIQLGELTAIYSAAGYPCLSVSALRGDNMEQLQSLLEGKINLLSGHSGVGKTELINALNPGLNLKTRKLSDFHQKGMHTTTFAEMFHLNNGGFIIDTPGIREFGLYDFKPEEIAERYPEMRQWMHLCKYYNCTHVHEPGCAVKEAVASGKIPFSRYQNYLNILQDDDILKNDH